MNPPPPPPPLVSFQQRIDADHLRLLMVFHYVLAGFGLVGLGFLGLHFVMMRMVMRSPQIAENMKMNANMNGPSPADIFAVFQWFYLAGALWLGVFMILNVLSAIMLGARRHRVFSIVVSAFNCLHAPLGTILGIFTIIVLLRDSVNLTYVERSVAIRA